MRGDVAVRLSSGGGNSLGRAVRWCAAQLLRCRARPAKQLCLCETLALGERRFLAVVAFGSQKLLIGGTASSVALLAQLPIEGNAEAQKESNQFIEEE